MEMELDFAKLTVEINIRKLRTPAKNVLGFCELNFFSDDELDPLFTVRGMTIKLNTIKNEAVYMVDMPAYFSKGGYQKSVFLRNDIFTEIREKIVNKFTQLIGDVSPDKYMDIFGERKEEIVNPNDIPL